MPSKTPDESKHMAKRATKAGRDGTQAMYPAHGKRATGTKQPGWSETEIMQGFKRQPCRPAPPCTNKKGG